jgi:molecular chaperone GrpE
MDIKGKEQQQTRIPIRFADDESAESATAQSNGADDSAPDEVPSAKEIGEQASYESETEVKQRIDNEPGNNSDAEGAAEEPDADDSAERNAEANSVQGGDCASDSSFEKFDNEPLLQAPPPAAGPVMAELIATRSELKRVEAENAELRDTLARRQADFDNFRKRGERERFESYNRVVGEVAGKLLPVVDNLRRALEAESTLLAGESEEFRHFVNGVELIGRQLSEVLSGLGVQPMNSVGKKFDPHLHEAVATELNEEYEPDTILQELVQGYVIGEKLLRPAVVKVSTR